MSGREWKAGDVGVTANGTLALRRPNGSGWVDSGGAPWSTDRFKGNVRPLVVLDPEDREEVERLADGLNQSLDFRVGSLLAGGVSAALAETLKALIASPKPEEPMGLGAVVEDAGGKKWLRCFGDPGFYVWREAHDFDDCRIRYADITAVTVLSEGVL